MKLNIKEFAAEPTMFALRVAQAKDNIAGMEVELTAIEFAGLERALKEQDYHSEASI